MKPEPVDCPSAQDMRSFLSGRLNVDDTDRIANHVETCSTCQSHMEQFDTADASVDAMLGGSHQIAFADESHCDRVTDAILAGGKQDKLASGSLRFGEYEVMQPLGQGGMGMVYQARHVEMGTPTAVKILQPHRRTDQATIDRFEREMIAIGRLDHPNIVRALDAGQEGDQHYLVMEFVDGFDLSRVASVHGSLVIADAAEVIRQAATGLSYVHQHGCVHRDIKPSNLILSRDGIVKLMDLGLARVNEIPIAETAADADDILGVSTVGLTRTHQIMGTPEYMPPEQLADSSKVDHRADIYSLGCTLYKLLTGQSPLASSGSINALNQLVERVQAPTIPVCQKREDTPQVMSDLLDRMLAKRPEERPQTAEEVAVLIRPFAAGANLRRLAASTNERLSTPLSIAYTAPTRNHFSTARDSNTESFVTTPSKSVHNRRARFAAAFAAALLALTVIAAFSLSGNSPKGTVVVLAESPEVSQRLTTGNANFIAGDTQVPIRVGTIEIPAGRYIVSADPASQLTFSQSTIELKRNQQLVLSVKRSVSNASPQLSRNPDNPELAKQTFGYPENSIYDPVDLISLIEPARDIRGKDWRLVDGDLVSDPDNPSFVMFPYQPPDEYRVELIATRLEKNESIYLGLVADGRPVLLAIDTSPSKGFLSGLDQINGINLWARPAQAHRGQLLPIGQPVPIAATLRRDGQRLSIEMIVDGVLVLSWRGSISQVTGLGSFPIPQSSHMFLANWTASIQVSNLRVIPLSGDGAIATFTDPKSDVQRAAVERIVWNGGAVSIVGKDESSEQPSIIRIDRWDDIANEPKIVAIDARRSSWIDDEDISVLTQLPDLESLDLSGTMVTAKGLQQLGSLPKLNSLSLSGTLVMGIPESLAGNFPSLETLDFQNTLITDASLSALNGLDELNSVDLGGTRLTGDGLSKIKSLPKLQLLNLAGTSVSGLDHLTIERFPELSRLNLLGTRVTSSEIHDLKERMPNTEIVSGLDSVDVIALVDVNRDADTEYNKGKTWRKEDGRLFTNERTRISLPLLLPSEFDFKMSATRISLGSAPVIGFALSGQHHFAVGFDSDPELGYYTIIYGIDGVLLQKSTAKVKGETFPIDADTPIEVEVRFRQYGETAEIHVYKNGVEVLSWDGERSRLQQTNVWWKGPHHSQPWISQYDGAVAIEAMTVTPVTGRIEASFLDEKSLLVELPKLNLDLRGRDINDEELKKILDTDIPTELTVEGPGITDESIELIAANRQLRFLALHETQITESGIAQLADLPLLERIELWGMPQITGEVTATLEKMPALKHVVSKHTSFYGPGLERLIDRPISGLDIGHPNVDADVLTRYVLPLKQLSSLDLAGSPIDDDAMKLFAGYENLYMLHLGFNQKWKGPGLEHLKQISTLRQLNLDASRVGDESLKYLDGANQIRELSLRKTAVGDASIETLCTLNGLKAVHLEQSQFTAEGVERLRKTLPLLEITFDEPAEQ